jgi:hypothetical protein
MMNFYRPFFMPCFGSDFENGRNFENLKTHTCSSNGDLSLCQILWFLPIAIFKMAVTIRQTFNIVRYHLNLICG